MRDAVVAVVERVLHISTEYSRGTWLTCGRGGLRAELIPKWAKSLWGDGTDLVPHRKFGWKAGSGEEEPGQPTNHHAECYVMAVLEGRISPLGWSIVQDGSLVPTSAPDWLTSPWFETLYECFTLLGRYPKPFPKPDGVYGYGDAVLRAATGGADGAGLEIAGSLRELRDAVEAVGYTVTDPDVLALPRAGGALVAIEAKTAGGDVLHADGGQENALALLGSLGARAEIWWVCDEQTRFKPHGVTGRQAPILRGSNIPLQVNGGIDWAAVRARARAGVTVKAPSRRAPAAGRDEVDE